MQVFIVRPFGTKQTIRKASGGAPQEMVSFDFDKVQVELIDPALKDLDLDGGTTGRIFAAGEIREDMFSQLLLADIVIADISIHNANVFYELGIRNALRDRTTILIKCPGYDDTPFDIVGFRYVSYDKEDPKTALEALKDAITASRESHKRDSPVFNLLPGLQVPDTEKFYAVPPDFTEEANAAFTACDAGKLTLMSREAAGFEWKIPALRLLGGELYRLRAYKAAQWAWEEVARSKPGDYGAADSLSTIYQRLAERIIATHPEEAAVLLHQSDTAIESLLRTDSASNQQRAEVYALKGRNAKTRWIAEWMGSPEAGRSTAALESGFWEDSLEHYQLGYYTNLNHYYSGINVLGLLTTVISLATAMPDTWAVRFDDQDAADERLKELQEQKDKLAAALRYTIESEQARLKAMSREDLWLHITHADYTCLTAPNKAKIAYAYKAIIKQCDQQQTNAIIRQLLIYRSLGVLPDNIAAALQATGAEPDNEIDDYYILFTGHMIDAPDRPAPRFPPSEEEAVRARIEAEVRRILQEQAGKDIYAIAGGASGGDILFHEVCAALGVRTEMYLALPREAFIVESVSPAGTAWIDRFDRLYTRLPHRILARTKQAAQWLQKKEDYSFWARCNQWMLYNALANDSLNMTLIALWDGKGGDGPGGTADMVKEVQRQGGRTAIIRMPLG